MGEKEVGFPFLKLPERTPKPRKVGVTIMSERGMPPGYQRDFLRMAADIIDYAKFTEHQGNIDGYPRELIEEKIETYREFGIPCFLGGIPFEVALLQGKVIEFFKRLKVLGFKAVEISEDVIPHPMTAHQRITYIKEARDMDLEVFTELGRKFPDAPLIKKDVIESVREDLAAGAKKVVIERSEIVQLMKDDPLFLVDVSEEIGKEHLIFEAGPGDWVTTAAWLIRNLGSDVNLENIGDKEILDLEGMRRLLTRDIGYAFFQ